MSLRATARSNLTVVNGSRFVGAGPVLSFVEACAEPGRSGLALPSRGAASSAPTADFQANDVSMSDRDEVDLDAGPEGEGGHTDRGAGWLDMPQVFGIDLVHLREGGKVGEVDGRLDNLIQ